MPPRQAVGTRLHGLGRVWCVCNEGSAAICVRLACSRLDVALVLPLVQLLPRPATSLTILPLPPPPPFPPFPLLPPPPATLSPHLPIMAFIATPTLGLRGAPSRVSVTRFGGRPAAAVAASVSPPAVLRMAADGPSATAPAPSEEEVESLGDAAVAAFERGVAGAVSARRHADPKVAVRTMLTRLLDASPTPINLTALGIIRLNVSEQDFMKLTDVSPRLLWVDSYRREVHVSEEGYIAAMKRWLKANPQ